MPPEDPGPLHQAARRIREYDWLIVTSARTVAPLVRALEEAAWRPEEVRGEGLRIWAVGPRTARALGRAGLTPDRVPERFLAEGLVEALLDEADLAGARILLPRAEGGRDVVPDVLRAAGARVAVVPAYRSVALPGRARRLAGRVRAGALDAVTFTAGSTATSFARGWGEEGGPWPRRVGVLALGPATAGALAKAGLPVDGVAEPHTLEGLADAVVRWAGRRLGAG